MQAACLLLVLTSILALCTCQPYLYNATRTLPAYIRGAGKYSFVLRNRDLQNGLRTWGSNERLRFKIHELLNGSKTVKVTVTGGSISNGHGAEDAPSWSQYLFNYLEDHFPNKTRGHNGAVAGSRSPYMSVCHRLHIPSDSDIIFVEYTVNDPRSPSPLFLNDFRRSFERLIRKLLSYPKKPAVVLMHPYSFLGLRMKGRFWTTAERELGEFALYYNLPELSVKGCCHHLLANNVTAFNGRQWRTQDKEGLKDKVFYMDPFHPDGRTGHRVMAELAMHLLQRTVDSLSGQPITEEDAHWAHLPLPEPMIPGNYESLEDRCLTGDKFVQTVIRKDGFEWRDDSKPPSGKFGFVAESPNSTLTMTISTMATATANATQTNVQVELAHLRSYEHMGRAAVTCVSGCQCYESVIEGHSLERHSLAHMHHFYASQSEECTIAVTVLQETSSGEHKVKLMGVVVSEQAGHSYGLHNDAPTADFMYNMRMDGQAGNT